MTRLLNCFGVFFEGEFIETHEVNIMAFVITFKLCILGHVYRHQQVEELLQSPPVSQQSHKQSRAKASRDTASERLWENRSLFKSRYLLQAHWSVSHYVSSASVPVILRSFLVVQEYMHSTFSFGRGTVLPPSVLVLLLMTAFIRALLTWVCICTRVFHYWEWCLLYH